MLRLATLQYQAGSRYLLRVEQLQTEQLAVEEHVIQLRNARIANRIRMHLAPGGSFDASPPAAELAGGE
jgi:multidrug efflux system outer membrane protein